MSVEGCEHPIDRSELVTAIACLDCNRILAKLPAIHAADFGVILDNYRNTERSDRPANKELPVHLL